MKIVIKRAKFTHEIHYESSLWNGPNGKTTVGELDNICDEIELQMPKGDGEFTINSKYLTGGINVVATGNNPIILHW